MMTPAAAPARKLVIPRLSDPRLTLATALTTYTILGQTVLYFNRDVTQIVVATLAACLADMALAYAFSRVVLVPLSAYITGLSVGILLESYDIRIYVLASLWGIASKHFIKDRHGHLFNPSNFAVVSALALSHGLATVAPGSQWGGAAWIAVVILALELMMMRRVHRLDLVGSWLAGYFVMAMLRLALGQGGLVFVIGPVAGAEFALFSFSMLPDPKTSPRSSRARIVWGAGIAVLDGVLRYLEVRYSMFISLFAFCALLPLFRRVATRSAAEGEAWNVIERPLRS